MFGLSIMLITWLFSSQDISIRISSFITSPFLAWMGFISMYISFKQRIEVYNGVIRITFWKNGIPYKRASSIVESMKLPEVKQRDIKLSEISFYGLFLQKDIRNLLNKESEFDQDIIMPSALGNFKMPGMVKKYREVIIFYEENGNAIFADGALYNVKQLEYLFGKIAEKTDKLPSGRLKATRSDYLSIGEIFISIIKFIMSMLLFLGIPIGALVIEGLLNSEHAIPYESNIRTVYGVVSMFAGLVLLLYISTFDEKANNDKDIGSLRKLSLWGSIILYCISIFLFSISTFM